MKSIKTTIKSTPDHFTPQADSNLNPPQPPETSPQPGCRLEKFHNRWTSISPHWSRVLKKGFRLKLKTRPPQMRQLPPQPRKDHDLILQQILLFLEKGAIEEVPKHKCQMIHPFFVIKQKAGKVRPILDCRQLNQLIEAPHFKMESLREFLPTLTKDDFLMKIDLQDAYLHVPIHPDSRPLLSFHFQGKFYRFKCLPFGVNIAPFLFTSLMKPVLNKLRSSGLHVLNYLDDFAIVGSSAEETMNSHSSACSLLSELGFLINAKKSFVPPSQSVEVLGLTIDTRELTLTVPETKMEKIVSQASLLRRRKYAHPRQLASFLGLANSVVAAIPLSSLQTRAMQGQLREKIRRGGWRGRILLTTPSLEELDWWKKVKKSPGKGWITPSPTAEIFTDASGTGWGASWGSKTLNGLWPKKMGRAHSNLKELKAVLLALSRWKKDLQGHRVLIRSDNMTTVRNIAKQGGAHSKEILAITKEIYAIAIQFEFTIQAVHIPGKENRLADQLSRSPNSARDEYFVSEEAMEVIQKNFGTLDIDLFASRMNHRLPKFITRWPDPQASGTDAFSIPWKKRCLIHPPPKLISRCLQKIRADSPQTAVLITPPWKTQMWFPLVSKMAREPPIQIPMSMVQGPKNHRLSSSNCGHLLAWKL